MRNTTAETGVVFELREFTVHDGPGVRLTVFLKGCPLHCRWCHNPEGLSREPQWIRSPGGARLVGQSYTAADLAEIINRQADVLRACGGGVTFSGGEPLLQAEFVVDVIDRLCRTHVVLDTSGFADETRFRMVAGRCQLIHFGLKLMDSETHRAFTGLDNAVILSNLRLLPELGVPFVIRVPLIPGVTDTEANLSGIAAAVVGMPGLTRVELLPFNRAAGGKYAACGMEFRPGFDESRPCRADTRPFVDLGLEVKVA